MVDTGAVTLSVGQAEQKASDRPIASGNARRPDTGKCPAKP